jgi:hypothetical protein
MALRPPRFYVTRASRIVRIVLAFGALHREG